MEAKFHVIEANVSYKALLGRQGIQNGEDCQIDSDINPFLIHKIKIYDETKYFHS